ncbi:thiamine-phosphate kinase [Candidatus Magnetaquicoccus inordinatus]|uniref:thiamine-phosphate kinase n=1 Tax=Candidatus Magnetaquicoccus inordinatus TaxID=2496818 RepID=UPI00102C7675|nr:thiamine-phosphate kinase [Candidatus Magnetaquicoccus inordinatus]
MAEGSMESVAALGEFALIERIIAPAAGSLPAGVALGIGDDAAVLNVPRTQQLVVTTDTLVEGIHFLSDADPFLLGQKALRVNLADLAAMAAQPQWYLLSLSLPKETPIHWVEGLMSGLRQAAVRPGGEVFLVGGNTTAAPTGARSLTITLFGLVGKDRAVTRAGAQAGDDLWVTGSIGDAALGLALSRGALPEVSAEDRLYLQGRQQLPDPPVEFARALQDSAYSRAAIDLSDGLPADLGHLCQMSKLAARVELAKIPLSEAAARVLAAQGVDLWQQLLTGGEDYELLFTAAPSLRVNIEQLAAQFQVRISRIGEMVTGSGVVLEQDGMPVQLQEKGWDHLR